MKLHLPLTKIVLFITLGFAFFYTSANPTSQPSTQQVLSLRPPQFVTGAQAATSPLGAKLDDEAGISAYFHDPAGISLNSVRSGFRFIESETADYIIGSVPIPNYGEDEDAHVYVNKNGWVLAYYLNNTPAARMFDIVGYKNTGDVTNNSKLKNALSVIASLNGSPLSAITYYDFRYPNATNILIIADKHDDGERTFTINMPSSYGYFERSITDLDSRAQVNGVDLPGFSCGYVYAQVNASTLLPDLTHTIAFPGGACSAYGVSGPGALVLVYRVP